MTCKQLTLHGCLFVYPNTLRSKDFRRNTILGNKLSSEKIKPDSLNDYGILFILFYVILFINVFDFNAALPGKPRLRVAYNISEYTIQSGLTLLKI